MAEEDYDLGVITELNFSTDQASFDLPNSIKPAYYGQCKNTVSIYMSSDTPELLGNLSMISALKNAFIHKIPCKIRIKFSYGQLYTINPLHPFKTTIFNPSSKSIHNNWTLINVKYIRP